MFVGPRLDGPLLRPSGPFILFDSVFDHILLSYRIINMQLVLVGQQVVD